MGAKDTKSQKREERLEVIVKLITEERLPKHKIVTQIRKEYEISARTIRRDFEEIGARFRAQFDDPNILEVMIGHIVKKLLETAEAAAKDKQFTASIRAYVEAGKMLGIRGGGRWSALTAHQTEVVVQVSESGPRVLTTKRALEVAAMDDAQLEEHHAVLTARFQVIEGGRE